MIYKIIEDKKWEYRVVKITAYDLTHNQLDAICDGQDGWEAYSTQSIDKGDKFLIFLKRAYIEQNKE